MIVDFWILPLLLQQATSPPDKPRDYTILLVTIGLFLLGQLIAALLWGGKINAQLGNMSQVLSDVPKKGDVKAEVATMQSELLMYVNEKTRGGRGDEVMNAIAELNRKIESIGKQG